MYRPLTALVNPHARWYHTRGRKRLAEVCPPKIGMLAQLTLIVVSATALCLYAGWGATRLALPTSLRPQAALFAPLIGYAITIYLGYFGASSVLNLRWSLIVLLALATVLNLLAWRLTGRARPLTALREHAAPIALSLATLLVGVLPLLHYGYLTTIGQGWDTESYLPLSQHLNDYTLAQIPSAPISPLRDLVRNPPGIGVTLGFSVFQGMTMLLSGQSALATFAPLLALLRALGILAIYAWLCTTMGLGRAAALLGAALASAGALMLWIGFFNFGMQMAAWPLLALGLAIGVAAVEELASSTEDGRRKTKELSSDPSSVVLRPSSRWGLALLAAIVLAALPVAYYPALTLWVPLAAGLGAALLIDSLLRRPGKPGPFSLVLAALAVGALALLLAVPTIVDYFQGFSFRYSLIAQHIGPDRFIAFTETLGLQAFRLPNDGPQPPDILVSLAVAIAGVFALVGLFLPSNGWKMEDRGWKMDKSDPPSSILHPQWLVSRPSDVRLRWVALLLAALAYLVWLRFVRPYEYAYMKGSAYAGFLAWGLFAFGAQALWQRAGRAAPPYVGILRPIVAVLAFVPLLVTGWAQAITIGDHWRGSANFSRDMAAIDQAARVVPAGATVAISGDPSFTGLNSGLISAAMYGREIWGHFSTAYSHLSYWPDGRMPQYAVLAADERPWPLELGGRELWRSGAAAIYQLDEQSQSLIGRSDFYSAAGADKSSPASLDIQRRAGAYRSAEPGAPLTLLVGETLRFGPGQPDGGAASKQLLITLASLASQRVSIANNATSATFDLMAGVNQIALPVVAPTPITITSEQTLALISATAKPSSNGKPPNAMLSDSQIAWSAAVEQKGPVIQLRVPIANPGRHALRIGLTLVEDTFDRPHTLVDLLAAAPVSGTWQLNLDPARGATEALVDGTPTPMLQVKTAPSPADGSYFAVLTLYDGAQIVAHAPVFTLGMSGGKLARLTALPFTVEATPVGRPAAPLPGNQGALLGDSPRTLDSQQAEVEGALMTRQPAWPGAPGDAPIAPGTSFSVQLFWRSGVPNGQPLMVSIQALDPENRKWAQWDGALGGDWRPIQAWKAGDRIRQDVPLRLDSATPPGSYRLALVAYDPATGQPQPFGGETMIQLGELQVQ